MEQKPEIVALIPVRGGSKSIPLKNIKPIAGKPLCLWLLEAVTKSKSIDRIYVSTDSEKIIEVVSSSGLPVEILRRDPALATDTASTESVMLDFMDKVNFDILITLQATSPLTTTEDIDSAIKYFLDNDFDSLLTGVRTKKFFWSDDGKPVNYNPLKRPRRQNFSGWIMENGAFYLTKRNILKSKKCRLGGNIGIYEMPSETSYEIDEPLDWEIVEKILIEKRKKDKKNNIIHRVENIEMLVMDVDGVLTDSFVYCDENGLETKRFSVRDGMGLSLIRKMGIKTGIITKENTDIIEFRAKKLKIDYVLKGIDNKLEVLKNISKKEGIPLGRIAYIGDDINDMEVLKAVGFSIAPRNAEPSVINMVDYVCESDGGSGCVREICNIILESSTDVK
jgi:YrbI family 3-deoxy-D-manno-octulosonate 8-phosphate phosphatase